MTLTITESEAEILRVVLNRFIEETRSEVHHTDDASYKETLKNQEQSAKGLLEKLSRK